MKCFTKLVLAALCPLLCNTAAGDDFIQWRDTLINYGGAPVKSAALPLTVTCIKQGYGELQANRSTHTKTPLKIGAVVYERGLGTHSNARIRVEPGRPAQTFSAKVGIDNNANTQGRRGSVRFYIKSPDGKVLAQTGVCKGGESAVALVADVCGLPFFEIVVDDGGDGIGYDQADLADACVRFEDDSRVWLDSGVGVVGAEDTGPVLPFAFIYNGVSSDVALRKFAHSVSRERKDGAVYHTHTWRDEKSGLNVIWTLRCFEFFPAFEANLTFKNTGTGKTGIIENIFVLRHDFQGNYTVHYATGGERAHPSNAFVPMEWDGKEPLKLTAKAGLSSGFYLPIWLMDKPGGGLYCALGWTGQWRADFKQDGKALRINAGMDVIRLYLKPGEQITQPSVLVGSYDGDRWVGHNALRRILYDEYVPLLDGKKPQPVVSWNHFFNFKSNINETLLVEEARAYERLGIDYFCIDSGWHMTNFYHVGDWRVNPQKFPNGLEPVAKAIRKSGMKMGLWFEPERVTDKNTEAFPHKDILMPAADGQPFMYHGTDPIYIWIVDMELPKARDWAFGLMDKYARELELKWIRFDFNTRSLATWRAADKIDPDRQGVKEIRYVEGLYNVLDRLLAAHPGLVMEWCAGGGRRIDLETIRRSHTFWKSDLTNEVDKTKPHLTGGNMYLPSVFLNSNVHVLESEYDFLGQFAGPLGFNHGFSTDTPAQMALARRMIVKYKEVRSLLQEDYYPLFDYTTDLTKWDGWQFNDPKGGRGMLIVLRPGLSPYPKALIKVRGLDPEKNYEVKSTVGPAFSKKATGKELSTGLEISLPEARTAMLVEYARIN